MEEYGMVFERIRMSKNISTKEISHGIVTPQFLRKFERGESNIRAENLLALLSRMHITTDEFFYMADNTLDAWLNIIEYKIDKAINTSNSFLLKDLIVELDKEYEITRDKKYYYFSLVTKNIYDIVFYKVYDESIVDLLEYLRESEYWGTMELFLASYAANSFS